MTRAERGAVLLEVIVALAMLTLAGGSLIRLVTETERTLGETRSREETLLDADRTLAGLVLLTRDDLDRRIGLHPAGRFEAEIRRPTLTLYRIALRTAEPGRPELLVTVVYRPRPAP
ncbi:MAG TPA: hypothetical protein VM387_05105 [Gemmatimonadales bacterium]|jgi:hypothetical protein|nr:hypothetical protein [Gemmatimonadales bacterium]